MDALAVAGRYFAAWNRRDPEAIAALFTEDGTYADPNVPDGLGPAALAEYAGGLFAGFPDLAFEIETEDACGDGRVAAQWLMTGTNDGAFQGQPPSGLRVALPGADVLEVEGDLLRSVRGYFDTAVVPRQLGLQVLVQPQAAGPYAFGTATYLSRSGIAPGAVSLTVLEARSEDERREVRTLTGEILSELIEAPGFISWLGVSVGDRQFTITAWEGLDDPGMLLASPAHTAAMRRFFGPDFAAGGQTGVWGPHRLNGLWMRCGTCGRMVQGSPGGACECGATLPEGLRYW